MKLLLLSCCVVFVPPSAATCCYKGDDRWRQASVRKTPPPYPTPPPSSPETSGELSLFQPCSLFFRTAGVHRQTGANQSICCGRIKDGPVRVCVYTERIGAAVPPPHASTEQCIRCSRMEPLPLMDISQSSRRLPTMQLSPRPLAPF